MNDSDCPPALREHMAAMMRFLLHLAGVVLCCTLSLGSAHAQDQAGGELIFVTPPSWADDQVSMQLMVHSAHLQRYDLLTSANFTVNEAADSLQVTSELSAPMTLLVLINLSFATDLDLVQQTLGAYFETYYRPEDEIIFFIQGPYAFEVAEPADLEAIRALIAGLTVSATYTGIGNGMVASALERLRTELDENPARNFQALHVASYFVTTDNPSIGRSFAALDVPLHVIQAHRFREDATARMRLLAENGGGLFVDNHEGRFVQTDPPVTALSSLRLAYDAIESSRAVYTFTYRPVRQDLITDPAVTLQVQLGRNRQLTADFTYRREFEAPQLAFVEDTLTLRRTPRTQNNQTVFDNTVQPIRAQVLFPDAVPRRIESVRLEVVDPAADQVLQSSLELQPEIDPLGYFNLSLSLQDFSRPDTTTPIRIILTLTDELGLTASTSLDGRVIVAALPLPPTAIPSPTIPPTATLPPPTAMMIPIPTGVSLNPPPVVSVVAPVEALPFENPVVLLLTGIILLLILIILGMLIRLRRIRQRQPMRVNPSAPSLATDGAEYDTDMGQPTAINTVSPPTPAPEEDRLYGRLIVVKGLPDIEILLTRQEFVIGRSETSNCDYVIPEPYISPRHCIVSYRNGKFTIRDLKSKNGVFVNGERIPVDRDVIVPIGSEVSITQNIVVELWDPNTVVSLQRSRQTHTTMTTHLQSRGSKTDFLFRPVPGIGYADDDEAVDDEYSPL